jgi:hypothetical protein
MQSRRFGSLSRRRRDATLQISCVTFVGVPTDWARVIVWKSPYRTLI